MIEAKDICLKYHDGTIALQNIDFKIKEGEVVYITGPSGSGKTSILKLLMGIEYPTTGSLKVLGQEITKDNAMGIRRLRRLIGPVFQDFKLLKGRTVMENIVMGVRFLGFSKKQMQENASSALIKVGLEHKALSLVDNLSLGESQRIAIARALARKPSLIIADEPTGNLDKENALNILELLTLYKDPKTTVIITTHATHLIEDIKEGMMVRMDGGHILCERLGEV